MSEDQAILTDSTLHNSDNDIEKTLTRFPLYFKQPDVENKFYFHVLEVYSSRLLCSAFVWSTLSTLLWMGITRNPWHIFKTSSSAVVSTDTSLTHFVENTVLHLLFYVPFLFDLFCLSVCFLPFPKSRVEPIFFFFLILIETLVGLWNNIELLDMLSIPFLSEQQFHGHTYSSPVSYDGKKVICSICRVAELITCTVIVPTRCRFTLFFISYILLNDFWAILILYSSQSGFKRVREITIKIILFCLLVCLGASCFFWRYFTELYERKVFYKHLVDDSKRESQRLPIAVHRIIQLFITKLEQIRFWLFEGYSYETVLVVISMIERTIKVLKHSKDMFIRNNSTYEENAFVEAILAHWDSTDLTFLYSTSCFHYNHHSTDRLMYYMTRRSLSKDKPCTLERASVSFPKSLSAYFTDHHLRLSERRSSLAQPHSLKSRHSKKSRDTRSALWIELKEDSSDFGNSTHRENTSQPLEKCLKNQFTHLLSGVGHRWDVNFFEIDSLLPNPMVVIGQILFQSLDFPTVHAKSYVDLLMDISRLYKPNPYHNILHACMVAHSTMCLTTSLGIRNAWDGPAMMSLIIAALGHDVAHEGRTNSYYVNTMDPLALLYNNESPLENMHASLIIQLIQERQNLFEELCCSKLSMYSFRRHIIEFILVTDMRLHFDTMASARIRRSSEDFNFLASIDDFCLIGKLCIKAADLCHGAIEWTQHLDLSLRVCEEFYQQGDEERNLGLTILPSYDRNYHSQFHKSQRSFLTIIVLPLFQELQSLYELKFNYLKKAKKKKTSLVDRCCYRVKQNLLRWSHVTSEQFVIPEKIRNMRSNTTPAFDSLYKALKSLYEEKRKPLGN